MELARRDGISPDQAKQLAQTLLELAPVYGTGESVLQLVTGQSSLTGEDASRIWAAVGLVPMAGGIVRKVGEPLAETLGSVLRVLDSGASQAEREATQAALALRTADEATSITTAPNSGAVAQALGVKREQSVADAVGGVRSGEIIKTTRGSTDVDVVDAVGNLIAVGGAAKANNLGNFVRGLMIYSETAIARGVNAYFYYTQGTPPSVINAATKVLGTDFVKPIP